MASLILGAPGIHFQCVLEKTVATISRFFASVVTVKLVFCNLTNWRTWKQWATFGVFFYL